jgi:cell fate regulator YaaT (PSP1 superfamily)
MAKDQNLVLNPQKVSGICGRLMCCLTFEQKAYEVARKGLPKQGKKVILRQGESGVVRDIDVLGRRVKVQIQDGTYLVVGPEEIVPPESTPKPPAPGTPSGQQDEGP